MTLEHTGATHYGMLFCAVLARAEKTAAGAAVGVVDIGPHGAIDAWCFIHSRGDR